MLQKIKTLTKYSVINNTYLFYNLQKKKKKNYCIKELHMYIKITFKFTNKYVYKFVINSIFEILSEYI